MWPIDAPAEPYYVSNLIRHWLIPLQLGKTPDSGCAEFPVLDLRDWTVLWQLHPTESPAGAGSLYWRLGAKDNLVLS